VTLDLSGDTDNQAMLHIDNFEASPATDTRCDVAQYLTTYRFPGRPETTTGVYGRARPGMFLPLLEASERADGAELIGTEVILYSCEPRRYVYRIEQVLRHATDRSIARGLAAGERRLVLQTSEGPRGTVPKLQVAARLLSSAPATTEEAMPPASPTVCYLP
jgi:hypothetical protein